jgi:16S rRNA (adenine1518-N6/adenine1519-N6)-dimethyltransferase
MGRPRLKKALGQHFLTRPEVCRPLLDFLKPSGRRVLEIGPGAGALTKALLDAGAEVLAWEVDPEWAVAVERRFPDSALSVVVGDATQIEWQALPGPILVAGNLPYNVATKIVLDCLESALRSGNGVDRAGFLVQREVGERLAAKPGGPGFGSLSVLVDALAEVRILGHVAPGAFRPPPKVDSSFVGLKPRPRVTVDEYARLKPLVRSAFAHRRKTLRNSLAATLGSDVAEALLAGSPLAAGVRAEQLDLEAFRGLAARVVRKGTSGTRPR